MLTYICNVKYSLCSCAVCKPEMAATQLIQNSSVSEMQVKFFNIFMLSQCEL